ncbi:MAG TPA: ABC transporter ATP-binding protein [Burkholderiaceae bacterium]|nr:ABC transporter ATP-binding protein [Burkholderiaceae bacterium]
MSRIHVDQVDKSYEGNTVLHGVSLDIDDGSVVALLGPSGCGKTTLLRLLAGFDWVDSGTIRLDDRVVAAPTLHVPPERRGVGYVPQEGALFPHLDVQGNVRYGLSGRADWRARVGEVLALTGLSGLERRYPHELSGGQQQRVALARALAPRPALILLDEPFNALDLDLRRGMCEDVITLLRKTGTTTVLVTHDPAEAFAVSDRIAVMHEGRIMQCAEPDVVYWRPASAPVARLTGSVVFLDGTVNDGHVETPVGPVPLYPSRAMPAGSACAMLRPEQITLGPPGRGIRARVAKRTFHGDHVLLGVVVDGLLELNLRMTSWAAPASGSEIFLSVHGSCVAFAPDDA